MAIGEVLSGLHEAVAELDPERVPDQHVARLWADFDAAERLAGAAKMLLARRVEQCEIWRREGHRSPADYMAAIAGGSVTGARATLTTSKRLGDLPATQAALRAGLLSGAQATRIADAASVNRGAEADLLGLAGTASLRELDDACGRAKAAGDPDPDATYRRIHRNRRLYETRDPEGAWCLHGRGTVDSGVEFSSALEPIIDELFVQARSEGRRETRERLAFDALVELARRSAQDTSATNDVETSSTISSEVEAADDIDAEVPTPNRKQRRQAQRKQRRVRNPGYVGLLRVDVEALQRGRVDGDELCEIAGVGPVPVSKARELLSDAVVKLVITRGVDVLNVTHLGRGPNVAQQMALLWQMPCCSVEGCSRTWVQNDHRVDWATSHHTRLDELDPLCHHHHDLKTRLGWALVAGKGKRAMVPPEDPRHPANAKAQADAT